MSAGETPVVVTAVPVAFDRDGGLNVDGTRQVFNKAAHSGVDGVLTCGTTGEFVSLDPSERSSLMTVAAEEFEHIRWIPHVGAASLYQVEKLIDQARRAGATEVALLTPYYLPTTDAAMRRFFEKAADAASDMDVYVYAFRDRTGNMVSSSLMADLAQIANVVGAKVSGEGPEVLRQYRAAVGDDFVLYTGDDAAVARVDQFGAQGVVSGNAGALPGPFTHLATLVRREVGGEEFQTAQAAVDDVSRILQGDMGRLKAALRLQGIDAGYPRMPIEEPDPFAMREIERVVQAYGDQH
jgi:4-hydroxy-tetrahydrodipicolinate synthase